MSVQIQLRRGTAAQWSTSNPILAEAEYGYELDTKRLKLGDGVNAWNDLAYFGEGGGGSGGYKVEQRTISGPEFTAKQLNLAVTCSAPSETLVFMDGGCLQKYGVDFTVSGIVLNWGALGMETIIEANDILIIQYKI